MINGEYLQRPPCKTFKALTGRGSVDLRHPTSSAYEQKSWDEFASQSTDQSDEEFYEFAKFVHGQLSSLRKHYFSNVFPGLSRDDSIRLAIASANAKVASADRKLRELSRLRIKSEGVIHATGVPATPLYAGEFAPDATIDDIVTWTVDRVPNWLFLANRIPEEKVTDHSQAFEQAYHATVLAADVENAYQDVWQHFLWQPHTFDPDQRLLSPENTDLHCLWMAWWVRYSEIGLQGIQLDKSLGVLSERELSPPLLRMVKSVSYHRGRPKIKTGPPSSNQLEFYRNQLRILEESYLGPFLDAKTEISNVEVRTLLACWTLLREFTVKALQNPVGSIFQSSHTLKNYAVEVSVSNIVSIFVDCLGLTADAAKSIIKFWTTDPTDVSTLFRRGIWASPIVELPSVDRILIAHCVLNSANLIRVASIWFEVLGLADNLEGSTLGDAFEQNVRNSCAADLSSNPLVDDFCVHQENYDKSKVGGEQIDILLRIGSTLLVGEVKCLMLPADPAERYSYVDKLKQATNQARRKANWLKANIQELPSTFAVGDEISESFEVKPFVILNQSAGVGIQINGVPITDVNWLSLVLSDGTYSSQALKHGNAKIYFQGLSTLYRDQNELEQKWDVIISNESNIRRRLNILSMKRIPIPTSDSRHFEMLVEYIDQEKLVEQATSRFPSQYDQVRVIDTAKHRKTRR